MENKKGMKWYWVVAISIAVMVIGGLIWLKVFVEGMFG
jgi:hypothetical protein